VAPSPASGVAPAPPVPELPGADPRVQDSELGDVDAEASSDRPALELPDTDADQGDVPVVEEPVVEEPVVEEPAVEEPAVEEPAVEEPAVEEPAVEEPAVEEPAVEEPAVEEPVVEEPVVEEPVVEEPVVEEPVVEEPAGNAVWNFASDSEDWRVGYSDPTMLADSTALSFSASAGFPEAGALEVQVPFTGTDQRLAVEVPLGSSVDMRGLSVTASLALESGMSSDTENPSVVKVFAKSGANYLYASGPTADLQPGGGWMTITFDIDAPDYVDASGAFDPSDVREIGLELNTGPSTGAISTAVIHIDNVDY
jgi:hypothetical protein